MCNASLSPALSLQPIDAAAEKETGLWIAAHLTMYNGQGMMCKISVMALASQLKGCCSPDLLPILTTSCCMCDVWETIVL